MLQHAQPDRTPFHVAGRPGTVEAHLRSVLARWPAAPAAAHPPVTRLAAGAGGRLARVAGGWPARSAGPANVEGRLVYAVGDVHGCYDLLIALLEKLAEDAQQVAAGRRATVVFLGDYVDRGPRSACVLDALCRLRSLDLFDLVALKGNHEQALLGFLEQPERGAAWLSYGGAETLAAYDVAPPAADDPPARYVAARDELLLCMPAAHLRFLQTLDVMAVIGGYAFVHAGVAPGEPLASQNERDLLWIRNEFLEATGPFDKVIVHGHTWTDDRAAITGRRIGLDTGAYETGVLTAMRIGDSLTVLQVRDPDRPRWRRPGEPPPWTPVTATLDFIQGAHV